MYSSESVIACSSFCEDVKLFIWIPGDFYPYLWMKYFCHLRLLLNYWLLRCDCGAHGLSSSSHRALAGQEVVVGWLVGANVVLTSAQGMFLGVETQVGFSCSLYIQSWAVCSQQSSSSIRPPLRTHEPPPHTPGGRTEGSLANVLQTQKYAKECPPTGSNQLSGNTSALQRLAHQWTIVLIAIFYYPFEY